MSNNSFEKDLLYNSPTTIFNLDKNGVFLDYIPSRKMRTYVPSEEFLGKRIQDVFPKELSDKFNSALQEILEDDKEPQVIYSLEEDGEIKHYKAELSLGSSDNIVVFVDNITDLVVAKESVRKHKGNVEYLVKIIDNSSDEILLLDIDSQRVIYANAKLLHSTGYVLEEIQGMYHAQLVSGLSLSLLQKDIAQGLVERNYYQFQRVKKNREKYYVEAKFKKLERDSHVLVCIAEDLTEQKFLHALLKRSESKYELFFNNAGLSIVTTDLAFNIVDFNKEFEKLCQFPKSEIYSLNLDTLLQQQLQFFGSLIQNRRFQGKITTYTKESVSVSVTFTQLTFDEESLYQFIISDISNVEKLKSEIELLKERFELAIENSALGLWDWDLRSNKVYYSKQLKGMLGFKQSDLVSTPEALYTLVHPDDKEKFTKEVEKNIERKTKYYELELRFRTKTGEYKWILDRGKTLFQEDKPIRMVGTHTDIDKRKRAEEKIIEKDKVILIQSRQAAMGEMISMIAHQWRQPISSISMAVNNLLVDIALDQCNVDETKKSLENINQLVEYLSKTISDFKNFFRGGKKKLVDFESIVQGCLSLVGSSLINNNIKFIYNVKYEDKIYADFNQFIQILLILINNAKDALANKDDLDRKIEVEIAKTNSFVTIAVIDNGQGVDETIKDKIFEPYFTTKDDKNGTGIGLYMVENIVQKHLRGKIFLEDTPIGAKFVVKIHEKFLKEV